MSTITPDTALECNICCDTYTKTVRKQIICPVCSYDVCKSCLKTYFLGSVKDFHCMNCEKGWTNDFVIDVLGISFIKGDYKKHKGEVLTDVEIAKLPQTMDRAARESKIRILNKNIRDVNLEIIELNKQVSKLKMKKADLKGKLHGLYINFEQEQTTSSKHIVPCTQDNCRGLLSNHYKCQICETKHCSKCHKVKEEEHECNDDDIETVKYILSQTKPCPKCGTRISKIDGCDQMWCVSCHVTFSWNTGIIQNGMIHNPHYHEFLRQLGNQTDGNLPLHECNGDPPTPGEFYTKVGFAGPSQRHKAHGLYVFYSHVLHIEEKINDKIRVLEDSTWLRVQYILGDFDKEKFKNKITRNAYTVQKEDQKLHLIEILVTTLRETIISMYNAHTDHMNSIIDNEAEKIKKLFNYCKNEFDKLSSLYKITPPVMSFDYNEQGILDFDLVM